MITPTYPGVYVLEQPSGSRAIAGVATSITAFVGTTQRGLLNVPQRIFSPRDYTRLYGSSTTAGAMEAQVRLYFDNGGGEAWVTRVAQDAQPADITLRTEAGGVGNETLTLTALEAGVDGNNLRAEVDYDTTSPESTFNLRLLRRVPQPNGSVVEEDVETFSNLSMNPDDNNYVGTALNNVSALASVAVDGAPQVPGHAGSFLYGGLILPADAGNAESTVLDGRLSGAGDYSLRVRVDQSPLITVPVSLTVQNDINLLGQDIAQAIQDQLALEGINQAVNYSANNPAGLRQMGFDMLGASFEFSPGPANDLAGPLMLTVPTGAIYVDQFAPNRPAPTGFVSQIHSAPTGSDITKLTDFAALTKANVNQWEITDASVTGSPGPQGIAYDNAGAAMIDGDSFAPANVSDLSQGALSNVRENLQFIADAITDASDGRWAAEVHGYRLVMRPRFGNSDADLTAAFFSFPGADDQGAVNGILDRGDAYNVAAYTFGTAVTNPPGGIYQDRLNAVDGFDGNLPEVPEYRAAFSEMERIVPIYNMVVLPRARATNGIQSDAARKAVYNVVSGLAAEQMAVLFADPPSTDPALAWDDANEAAAGANAFRIGIDTQNTALFWPRLRMADGSFQDPSGPIAGLHARIDGTRGLWKAAAGVEATLRGVTGVEYQMSDPENGLINPLAVNGIRVFPSGIVNWGARMLIGFDGSGNVDQKYVPVRRMSYFILKSLQRGLQFAVFEPNDEPLWAQIRLAGGSFMNTLFRQGAFAGQKASDAYFVNCDSSTTTPTDINLGIVNVVVGFAPLKPAEFVIVTLTQIAGQAEI